MVERDFLPYGKNCEGYFLCSDGSLIARDTGKGFLELPGGGVDRDEDVAQALLREAFEEAGVLADTVKHIDTLTFLWDANWAKTEKQKKRYLQFKGEEMCFFFGKVKKLVDPPGDPVTGEPGWKGDPRMSIEQAISVINSARPFTKDVKVYRLKQLEILSSLQRR